MVDLNIKLSSDFLQEEIREGYTISSSMKKIWAVEFDLLSEFQRVCEKHRIKWWIDGGTLLGAVRHAGMIPWDDDIDVMLMRDEYDRLCSVAQKEFSFPYFFQTNKTDPGSMRGHAQLRNSATTGILMGEKELKMHFNQGIFIDIFPIDTIPADVLLLEKQVRNVAEYKLQARTYWNWKVMCPNDFKRRLKARCKFLAASLGLLHKGIDYRHAEVNFEREIRKYNSTSSNLVAKLVLPPFKPRRIWRKEWFEETVYLNFEWMKLPAPKGYVELLDTFYGNWREYVVGVSSHGGVFFDTDRSYKEYI